MSDNFHRLEDYFPPDIARVHEVYGAGAAVFALSVIGKQKAIWLNIEDNTKISAAIGNHIIFITMRDPKTQLWCMEEALGSSAVPVVICEREKEVSFRDMRRLQLAAERGQATGLLLTSERFANPATQTRWQCLPIYNAEDEIIKGGRQIWSLVKNKKGILRNWEVDWDDKTHRIFMV